MKQRRTKAALMLTMIMSSGSSLGLGGDRSSTIKGAKPTITLRVVNEAGVDHRTLLQAEKEAAAILDRAGVELASLTCEAGLIVWGSGNPCQSVSGATEFWFHIVSRRPAATTGEMLGFTELDEDSGVRLAGVYYPAAIEVAKKYQYDVFQILGAAIAHEVGHLILGADAHSPRGVMSARWDSAQFELIRISELSFTSDQAKLLRDEVGRRTNRPIVLPGR